MNYYLLLLITTIIAILPVIFIKKYIISKNNFYVILGLVTYALLFLCYYNLFSLGKEVSIVYTILQILQIFIVFIVGILMFNESITNNKIIGTLLGITSIYFLLK